MKNALTFVFLSLLLSLQPILATQSLPGSLQDVVLANRYAFNIDERDVGGEGAARLLEEARAADIVMFGENHGAREITIVADALYRATSAVQPRLLITEVSPLQGAQIERRLRAGAFRSWLADGLRLQSVPFFNVNEELPLLESALDAWPQDARVIYGLDQEFMAAAPLVLEWLEQNVGTHEERLAIAETRRAALLNPFLFGMGSGEPLEKLQHVLSKSARAEVRRVVDGLVLTHRIYRAQMGGEGAASNEWRETHMMENFLRDVASFDPLPPLFLKFGAFHLFTDAGPSVKRPLGQRISQWAAGRDLSVLNMFVECAGGEVLEPLLGGTTECEPFMAGDADAFGPLLIEGGATLFDLRPLRGRPELENVHWRVRYVINGFAYLLLIPDVHASEYLPGTLVTHRYGLVYGGMLLLTLAGLSYLFFHLLRRRRRKRAA